MASLLSRSLFALGIALLASAAAESALARAAQFTCAGGNSATHDTRVHFRNVTDRNAMIVRSVKIYNSNGFLLKDIPAVNPFPAGFVRNVRPHGTSVLSTSDLFGAQEEPQLTLVFNVALLIEGVPYLVQDVHFIFDGDSNVLSRDTQNCLTQIIR